MSLNSDLDFQTYYYYYGCAVYQVECNLRDCQHYFELALSYTMNANQPAPRNPVELLLVNTLGFIYAQQKRTAEAFSLFKIVNAALLKIDAQTENLNVIHFQQGKIHFELKQYDQALDTLLTGLKRINQLGSTFMVNNYALLILDCYQHLQ
ncbi:hypothetical protein EQ500_09300 [Lactobacillus sp. XV13L]|nr:hypothetical protein [Lactobacillus sp. XV13L]